MKKGFLLFATLFMCISMLAKADNDKFCHINQSDYSLISLTLKSGDLTTTTIATDSGMHTLVSIDGFFPSGDVGNPNLPVLSRTIEIPLCGKVNYRIVSQKTKTYSAEELGINHPIYPVQPPHSKSEDGPFPLVKNNKTYSQNAFYSNNIIEIEKIGIARNTNLANVYFSPIKYNPVSNQLTITTEIEIEITFAESNISATRQMKRLHSSPAFSVKAEVANAIEKDAYTTGPQRYLIVSHASFRGELDSLVEWKKRKGFLVDIVYTDDAAVGNTTTSIQNYLKKQYDDATLEMPAPTYVLLVGDVAQIPPFDSRVSSSAMNDHITDLYYFTWTDGDIIPDCYFGRFSAENVNHLRPQVEKTLMYEQYRMSDPSYLDKALIVAGEDGGYQGDHGYTHADPVIHYLQDNYVNSNYGYTSVVSYYNPASSTASAENGVYNALSNGVGFANYTAHCNYSNWSTPNFNTTDVSNMKNTEKFGLMIGNCCLSNKFDVGACLGEALLRKGDYRGAVGYIGGSNSTYWDQDYWWAVGVRSINTSTCPTPTYMANKLGAYDRLFHTHNESYADWYTSNGAIIMAGNMAVQQSTTSSTYKTYYWEIYHLMGDPSIMSWLTQADTMTVQVNNTMFNDATSLRVEAVPYAYVAFTDYNKNLVAATFADASGVAVLNFDAVNTVGQFEVAVSAQNYITEFVTINVIVPEGPFVSVTSTGTENNNATVGTDVKIAATVSNIGVDDAQNAWVKIESTNTAKLIVYDSIINIGSMSTNQTDSIHSRVHIMSNVKNNEKVAVVFTVHFDGKTSTYTYNFTANGYSIKKVSESVRNITDPSRNFYMPGDSIVITRKYQNNGSLPLRNTRDVFYSPNPYTTTTNSQPTVTIFTVNNTITKTYTAVLGNNVEEGISIPLYNTMTNGTYIFRDTLEILVGKVVEDFESNNLTAYPWQNGNQPWEITSAEKYEGTYSLRSKTGLDHKDSSEISITWTSIADDSICFMRKVSSETNYDKFRFFIDNQEQENASGDVAWTRVAFYVPAGTHTFKFSYKKDYSVSNGSDCAWIDNVKFPAAATNSCTYIADTICQGGNYTYGNISVDASSMAAGNYYYADSTGNNKVFVMLTVAEAPNVEISGTSNIMPNQSVKLTASGAHNYSWNIGETIPTITVLPSKTTTYTVVGTTKNCAADTASFTVIVDGTGIATPIDSENHNVKIYPNPANNIATISSDAEIKSVTVFNTLGNTVDAMRAQGNNSISWNVAEYASGLYVVVIEHNDGTVEHKHLVVANK